MKEKIFLGIKLFELEIKFSNSNRRPNFNCSSFDKSNIFEWYKYFWT